MAATGNLTRNGSSHKPEALLGLPGPVEWQPLFRRCLNVDLVEQKHRIVRSGNEIQKAEAICTCRFDRDRQVPGVLMKRPSASTAFCSFGCSAATCCSRALATNVRVARTSASLMWFSKE